MSTRGLVVAGLRHYWRSHLGVVLGAAIGAAVLIGALLVGDSVRASLRAQALNRIGAVDAALVAGDRFFGADLGRRIASELPEAKTAAVLQLSGIAATSDGKRRVNDAQILGVDEDFFELAPGAGWYVGRDLDGARQALAPLEAPAKGEVYLNRRLAHELGVERGDTLLIRLERPSALPRDAALATSEDLSFAQRLEVRLVLDEGSFGRFGLAASQVPPFNAYVSLAALEAELELEGSANLVLAGSTGDEALTPAVLDAALARVWKLDDAGLATVQLEELGLTQIETTRVFLEAPVEAVLEQADTPVTGIFTWFVNSIESGARSLPYSSVAGLGSVAGALPPEYRAIVPDDVQGAAGADGIVLNRWAADDLDASVGDPVKLSYFVVGPGGRLVEESAEFTLKHVVELAGAADDRTLMPDFPGITDSENCRDWEPGIPVELDRIRDEDEAYWDVHGGTPKAFLGLAVAQRIWANRFGALTAARVESGDADALVARLASDLTPESVGLFFRDIRTPALAASSPSTEFGGLFLALSFFLLVAAFLLTALLFRFGVEQRASEVGVLLALGFPPARVRRLFLFEASLLATLGALLGAFGGVGYTRAVLWGLANLWSGAVGSTQLELSVGATTVVGGAAASVLAALGAIRLTLRRLVRRPAQELLHGELADDTVAARRGRRGVALVIGGLSVIGALAITLATRGHSGAAAAGAFFGAGSLCLVAALCAGYLFLQRPGTAEGARSVFGLGVRNGSRRPARSLSVVALLASGVFLVVAVGANRLESAGDPTERASGTGGFTLFASSALPVLQDLNTPEGLDEYALTPDELPGVAIVPLRARDGDDASCLNLSTPSEPRLLAVDPDELARRGAFAFSKALDGPSGESAASPWSLLAEDWGAGVVPAIADQASVTWTLHKQLGEGLTYRDERGRSFEVRIVATLAGSMLQGDLVVDATHFEARYPSESGARVFLIDAPLDGLDEVRDVLGDALQDLGLSVSSSAERLAAFNAVQNTYITIFQVLGALGVLLGSAGLGMVVLRNTLERRAELATLRAIGYSRGAVRRLVFGEHGLLLLLGLGVGTLPALLAILPAVQGDATSFAVRPIALWLAAVGLGGVVWITLATLWGLRGVGVGALRND